MVFVFLFGLVPFVCVCDFCNLFLVGFSGGFVWLLLLVCLFGWFLVYIRATSISEKKKINENVFPHVNQARLNKTIKGIH